MCHYSFRSAAPSLDQETLKSCCYFFGAFLPLSFFLDKLTVNLPKKQRKTARQNRHFLNTTSLIMGHYCRIYQGWRCG